jgi:predicted DCC family thiol-disulfide oxidoreductase YuxK
MESSNNKIVLFDGVCNLCNSSVQFIIKHDKKKQFRFASLQGKFGQEVLKKNNFSSESLNTLILIEEDKIFTRSTGVLRMLKHLGGGWSLLYGFIILPAFIRDAVYNWVSKNRYKWFGKKDECMIPTKELKERFLD